MDVMNHQLKIADTKTFKDFLFNELNMEDGKVAKSMEVSMVI